MRIRADLGLFPRQGVMIKPPITKEEQFTSETHSIQIYRIYQIHQKTDNLVSVFTWEHLNTDPLENFQSIFGCHSIFGSEFSHFLDITVETFWTPYENRNIYQVDTLYQLNTRKVWCSGPHWLIFHLKLDNFNKLQYFVRLVTTKLSRLKYLEVSL